MTQQTLPRKTYRVIVGSAFEGGKDVANFTVEDSAEERYWIGEPFTAAAIARHYAAEYCDSGTVVVENVRNRSDRAHVARRLVSQ